MTTLETQEKAVRDYLTYISNPEDLRDEDEIQALQEQLDATDDSIERLRIHEAITTLRDLPESSFLEPFVENALAYANREGITASAFMEMGVERKVLAAAGFDIKGSVKRCTKEQVREYIQAEGLTEFTKRDLIEATNASPATVTRAIEDMITDGEVVKTDRLEPNHSGRGAKATVYEVIDNS